MNVSVSLAWFAGKSFKAQTTVAHDARLAYAFTVELKC
jgi:hypothetical protein